MSNTVDDAARRQELSALMDGEADSASLASACACWRDEPKARCDWHDWHLIGDVLRSGDLAGSARHDAALIAAVRKRLVAEPGVIAPVPAEKSGRSARRAFSFSGWGLGGAIAAGFLMVAGVLVLTAEPTSSPRPLVGATPPTAHVDAPMPASDGTRTNPAMAEPFVHANGELIRDARLYGYWAAHKPLSGTQALALRSSVRPINLDAPTR